MIDDNALVKRALGGDKEAFEMIILKYQTPLFNYIGRMTGQRELSRDITQDIFIKAYSNLHTFRPQYKFSTWLYKIASNTMIDFWRKKKIDAFSIDQRRFDDEKPDFQIPSSDMGISEKFELTQMRRRIEKILKKIPPSLRELFVWRHVNELSYEEIAEIKGIPIGTVKNRVYQAKEMIRSLLEQKA